MSSGKILVVDDLPDWRATISGLLRDRGYDVQTAASAGEAWKFLEQEPYHIAILDVRLDETDEDNRSGLALMRQIKDRWPSTQVIILTGYADVTMAQEALNVDHNGKRYAYAFIEKTQAGLLLEQVELAYEHSIYALIDKGEQENIEFKASIRWDYQRKQVNKGLQKNIIKTIAGMLNNKGGKLLVGVADDGEILGIEQDLQLLKQPTVDQAELLLTNIIQDHLGLDVLTYVAIRFETIAGKIVCVIDVQPSPAPVFLISGNTSEFWVRVRNSTQRLDVKDATKYIRTRWSEISI